MLNTLLDILLNSLHEVSFVPKIWNRRAYFSLQEHSFHWSILIIFPQTCTCLALKSPERSHVRCLLGGYFTFGAAVIAVRSAALSPLANRCEDGFVCIFQNTFGPSAARWGVISMGSVPPRVTATFAALCEVVVGPGKSRI